MSKNIEMNYFNGSSYEKLIPNTVASDNSCYLTEETAALFNLGGTAVPNDVFKRVSGSILKVGDILNTIRTDLGENWVLCNGDNINASELGEIKNMLGIGWGKNSIANSYADGANNLYMCRRWVIHGDEIITYSADKTSKNPQIYIANKNNPLNFETVTIYTGGSYENYYLIALAYGNGMWVAIGCGNTTVGGGLTKVFTATDLRGPWTMKSGYIGSVTNFGPARYASLAYGNGNWVFACQDYNNSNLTTIGYATDPTGEWTSYQLNSSAYAPIDLLYDDSGRWVLLTNYNNNSIIQYTSNPTKSSGWTQKNNTSSYSYGLRYINGYYVICARTVSENYYPVIFYTNDLTGTWTRVQLSSSIEADIKGIAYNNGQWVVCGETSNNVVLFTASSLSGEWTISYPSDAKGNTMAITSTTDIIYIDGRCVLLGVYSGNGVIVTEQVSTLPTISIDGVYTYIKIKEDEV